jgi:ferredoxin
MVVDGTLTLDELPSAAALPAGWVDEQEAGRYRLKQTGRPHYFSVTHGSLPWKRLLHPPVVTLWKASRDNGAITFAPGDAPPRPLALLGVRACDLAALAIHDTVLLGGPHQDAVYRERREGAFVVAVQCARAGGTCFCSSMGTGPRGRGGFDLALTEVVEGKAHWFRIEVGTRRGADVLVAVPHRPATGQEVAEAERLLADVPRQMGRTLDAAGLPARLAASYEHLHWNSLEERCLSCGNCTYVCPTCFCVTVEESAPAGAEASRVRKWDSCFSTDFSYIHGGSVRPSVPSRYRQFLLHKLSTWVEQFGTSGCVGCGRCISWCPVGIDLTSEARAVAQRPRRKE